MLLTYMFVLVVQPVRKLVWLAMRINGVFGLGLVSPPSIVAEAGGLWLAILPLRLGVGAQRLP